MEDDLLNRMTEFISGMMVIQYTLAACLNEAGIISKASLAEILRKSARDQIHEPGALDAIMTMLSSMLPLAIARLP